MFFHKDFIVQAQEWYASEQGAFALDASLRLTERMLAPWARRGHSLLDIGCSHPQLLHFFWESGLDIHVATPLAPHASWLTEVLGTRIAVHTGNISHLPFDDKAFDYVTAMVLPHSTHAHVATLCAEAIRLAAKGVLIQFWNPYSLAGIAKRWQPATVPSFMHTTLWCSWRQAHALAHYCAPRAFVAVGSIAVGPVRTWRIHAQGQKSPLHCWKMPLGALMQIRITYPPLRPLTGIPLDFTALRLTSVAPATAIECRVHTQKVDTSCFL